MENVTSFHISHWSLFLFYLLKTLKGFLFLTMWTDGVWRRKKNFDGHLCPTSLSIFHSSDLTDERMFQKEAGRHRVKPARGQNRHVLNQTLQWRQWRREHTEREKKTHYADLQRTSPHKWPVWSSSSSIGHSPFTVHGNISALSGKVFKISRRLASNEFRWSEGDVVWRCSLACSHNHCVRKQLGSTENYITAIPAVIAYSNGNAFSWIGLNREALALANAWTLMASWLQPGPWVCGAREMGPSGGSSCRSHLKKKQDWIIFSSFLREREKK